jgi:hypothetical protein
MAWVRARESYRCILRVEYTRMIRSNILSSNHVFSRKNMAIF